MSAGSSHAKAALSPMALHRRSQLLLVGKEVICIASCVAVSLALWAAPHDEAARIRAACINSNSTACASPALLDAASSRLAAVCYACAADPVEACCVFFHFFFLVVMMGGSPLAWLFVVGLNSVDASMWDAHQTWIEGIFGDSETGMAVFGYGFVALACFVIP